MQINYYYYRKTKQIIEEYYYILEIKIPKTKMGNQNEMSENKKLGIMGHH